ncbi:nucleoside triphosphate pyrophosphohydrolase [Peribacillus saganii]|uniref:Nucleoside triphosphate pyrophosphohydrolase n=1 Tax=Peribacillus saganii TaxID=2303992 RepID=A0A372LL53_9BACI|nr:nucleoside triphosphate pyrophosphohydrolase [Peribacillus saganii]RFU66912.1 nucleoside triphosphate pyrophosphohydrolase [Peribacillus saganii]
MNQIKILGLGAGELDQLPLGVYRKIIQAGECFTRTIEHPVISDLAKEGISFQSFDHVYEKHDQFEEVYEEIVETLLDHAANGTIIYTVPGHPMVAEKTVQLLFEKAEKRGIQITVDGGQSFLDPLFQAVAADPIEGFQLLDGTDLKRDEIIITQHMIIGQVYDAFVASEVKLTLMEKLPDDYEVSIVTAAGTSHEKVIKVPLFELDRQMELSNLTSVYVPPIKEEELLYHEFSKLREIIAVLRGPNGCPWDKKQTHESLKKYLIEETYEVIDAIDSGEEGLVGELGDVLLQVLLHSQIGEDEGLFTVDDVIRSISEKMVRRHPHVFGDAIAETAEEVRMNWDQIKALENNQDENLPESFLAGISPSLPQLMQSFEYQKAAAKVGFDWDKVDPAWEKVKEEMNEVEAELLKNEVDHNKLKSELGDLFFSIVNVSRFYRIQPEEAVHTANRKFQQRFSYIEKCVRESGKSFADFSLDELDHFWDEAKAKGL